MTYFLYRHYDKSGHLLYIGITRNLKARNKSHLNSSKWFCLVSKTETCEFTSKPLALVAERNAIIAENPKFNKLVSRSTLIAPIEDMIKSLIPEKGFMVETETDRQLVCRAAATLKKFGQIDFDIVTKKTQDGFKVVAI